MPLYSSRFPTTFARVPGTRRCRYGTRELASASKPFTATSILVTTLLLIFAAIPLPLPTPMVACASGMCGWFRRDISMPGLTRRTSWRIGAAPSLSPPRTTQNSTRSTGRCPHLMAMKKLYRLYASTPIAIVLAPALIIPSESGVNGAYRGLVSALWRALVQLSLGNPTSPNLHHRECIEMQ
eukprot:20755_3